MGRRGRWHGEFSAALLHSAQLSKAGTGNLYCSPKLQLGASFCCTRAFCVSYGTSCQALKYLFFSKLHHLLGAKISGIDYRTQSNYSPALCCMIKRKRQDNPSMVPFFAILHAFLKNRFGSIEKDDKLSIVLTVAFEGRRPLR